MSSTCLCFALCARSLFSWPLLNQTSCRDSRVCEGAFPVALLHVLHLSHPLHLPLLLFIPGRPADYVEYYAIIDLPPTATFSVTLNPYGE